MNSSLFTCILVYFWKQLLTLKNLNNEFNLNRKIQHFIVKIAQIISINHTNCTFVFLKEICMVLLTEFKREKEIKGIFISLVIYSVCMLKYNSLMERLIFSLNRLKKYVLSMVLWNFPLWNEYSLRICQYVYLVISVLIVVKMLISPQNLNI